MPSPIDRIVDRFGTEGVRRFGEIPGLILPSQVGPYFHSLREEPCDLPAYAAFAERRLPDGEWQGWARLGSDRACELVVSPEGQVGTVLLEAAEHPFGLVNSSVGAFATGLVDLDVLVGELGEATAASEAEAALRRFERRLRESDPAALSDREGWWSRVLDDLRDSTAVETYAAFEVVDDHGEKKVFTGSGGLAVHAEEQLWSRLSAAGVRAGQVARVYTELEACALPGHYCALWLALTFPEATVTHSFPYGDTAQSRAEGIRRLRAAVAERKRQG